MPYALDTAQILAEQSVSSFFQTCEGDWCSKRRYYTLKSGEAQEVVSDITIHFLVGNHSELLKLADSHQVDEPMICGAQVTWESHYISPSRKPSTGATVFGIRGDIMYRDRGFATPKPVTATYKFTAQRTMVLRTE